MEERPNNNSLLKATLVLAIALASIFAYLYFNEKKAVSSQNLTITEPTLN
jgi:hypothetical protein